jgi:WD40 repeat protein
MPRTALKRGLRAMGVDSVDDQHFQDTLWEASPFLRYGSDPQSGETLYRLFHQGLADYLHAHPTSEDPLDETASLDLEGRLLSELITPYTSDAEECGDPWEAAESEPYVLRHALGHAARAHSVAHAESLLTDPYFLIRFDLREDHRALDLVQSKQVTDYLRLLSASWAAHAHLRDAAERASVFAFDADRLGLPSVREQFARIAQEVAVQPEAAACSLLWSRGGRVNSNSRSVSTAGNSVNDIAFSPDGTLLAAAISGGVQVLETETWQSVAPLFGKASFSWVHTVAFSPNGRLLAFARHSFTRSVQLWDVQNRVLAGQPWQCRTGTVTALAFSSDSRWLATASEELGVSVWDITGDSPLEEARWDLDESEDSGRVLDLAFSPVGHLLAVCSSAGVALWHPADDDSGTSVGTEYAQAVAFSPDGSLLAAAVEGRVVLYSVAAHAEVGTVDLRASELAFTRDGGLLVASCWREFCVIDTASMRVVNRLPVAAASSSIAVRPDTSVLVSGDSDGHLRLWKSLTDEAKTPRLPQFDGDDVVASPDGRFIAVQDGERGLLTLRDPVTGADLASCSLSEPLSDLTISPDGSLLAALSFRRLHIFPTAPMLLDNSRSIRLSGRPLPLVSLVFSPDSRLIGMACEERRGGTQAIEILQVPTLHLCARIPIAGELSSFGFAGPQQIYVVVDGALGTYSYTPLEPEVTLP